MKEPTSVDHFEASFDAFLQVQSELTRFQVEMIVASMTVGIEFWELWHQSRGHRALQLVDQGHFDDHMLR